MKTKKELENVHKQSSYHRDTVNSSSKCGCFHCLSTFEPEEIREWIDKEETALCPKCGIDSVLPEEFSDEETLFNMQDEYFLTCIDQYGNVFKLNEIY